MASVVSGPTVSDGTVDTDAGEIVDGGGGAAGIQRGGIKDSAGNGASVSSLLAPSISRQITEPCVTVAAGNAGFATEVVSLMHAARYFRGMGKSVVWDFSAAAATCPCNDASVVEPMRGMARGGAAAAAATTAAITSTTMTRRLPSVKNVDAKRYSGRRHTENISTALKVEDKEDTAPVALAGEVSAVAAACSDDDNSGWTAMFSSTAVFSPSEERALAKVSARVDARSAEGLARHRQRLMGGTHPGALRANSQQQRSPESDGAGAAGVGVYSASVASCVHVSSIEGAAAAAAATHADNSPETTDGRLLSGVDASLCETASGVWRLSPTMRTELNATLDALGGDPGRLVVFHVSGSGGRSGVLKSGGASGSDANDGVDGRDGGGGRDNSGDGVEQFGVLPDGYDMDISKGVERLATLMQPAPPAGQDGRLGVDEETSVKTTRRTWKQGKDGKRSDDDDKIVSSEIPAFQSHSAHSHRLNGASSHLHADADGGSVSNSGGASDGDTDRNSSAHPTSPHVAAAGTGEEPHSTSPHVAAAGTGEEPQRASAATSSISSSSLDSRSQLSATQPIRGSNSSSSASPTTPGTLMERFKWWLAKHNRGDDIEAQAQTARRLLSSKMSKSSATSSAPSKSVTSTTTTRSTPTKKEASGGETEGAAVARKHLAVSAGGADKAPTGNAVAEEDMSLLQRSRERFKSFELAMDRGASASVG